MPNNRGYLRESDILDLIEGLANKEKETEEEIDRLRRRFEENGSGGNLNDRAESEREVPVLNAQLILERKNLADIKFAIQRFSSFPRRIRCSCGNLIFLERLETIPWAEICQDCVRKTNDDDISLKNHYHHAHIF